MKPKRTVRFSDYAITPGTPAQKDACIKAALKQAGTAPRGGHLIEQIKTQLGYVGPWFFIGTLMVLLAMLLVFGKVQNHSISPDEAVLPTLALLSMAGPAIACLAAPILARSRANDMWELEEAAFHSLPQLTALRILICTVSAIPVLAVLVCISWNITGVLYGLTALAVPFLLINGINYFILGRLHGVAGSLCCVGVGVLFAVLIPLLFSQAGQTATFLQSNAAAATSCFILCAATLFFILSARRFTYKPTAMQ